MSWRPDIYYRSYWNQPYLTASRDKCTTYKRYTYTEEQSSYSVCYIDIFIFLLAMTTLVPRPPYTQDELESLYPKTLKLQLVQIVRPLFSASTGAAGCGLGVIVFSH